MLSQHYNVFAQHGETVDDYAARWFVGLQAVQADSFVTLQILMQQAIAQAVCGLLLSEWSGVGFG